MNVVTFSDFTNMKFSYRLGMQLVFHNILFQLDLRNNFRLHSIVGTLPVTVRDFRLTNTQIRYLPPDFFIRFHIFLFPRI